MRQFFRAVAIQYRTIFALMMREIYARYGRENIGFLWTFAEPLCFVFPVLTMWHFIRPKYGPAGLLWADISWSGYLPIMLYRHLTGHSIYVVRNNAPLFYHRQITTYDLFGARMLIEVMGNIAASFFSLFVFVAIGEMDAPRNWAMLYIGWFYMIWWSAAAGLVLAGLSERSIWVEKIWIPAGYMYIAISGCFYMANWLPPSVRKIALLQPSLQAYEMIRNGMFDDRVPTYFSYTYATLSLAVLTIIGLAALRSARSTVILS